MIESGKDLSYSAAVEQNGMLSWKLKMKSLPVPVPVVSLSRNEATRQPLPAASQGEERRKQIGVLHSHWEP
jgi:hypothetical protein